MFGQIEMSNLKLWRIKKKKERREKKISTKPNSRYNLLYFNTQIENEKEKETVAKLVNIGK